MPSQLFNLYIYIYILKKSENLQRQAVLGRGSRPTTLIATHSLALIRSEDIQRIHKRHKLTKFKT